MTHRKNQCNCENSHCEHYAKHDEVCHNDANPDKKIMFIGCVCDDCYDKYPEEYHKDELKTKAHLMAYDLLKSQASWLENPNNEIFSLLEFDDDSLNIVARAAIIASAVLKKAALDIQLSSGIEDTNKYDKNIVDAMNDLKKLADEFDESGNEDLIKKASLLDEILITMASGVEERKKLEQKFDNKIAEIKERAKNKLNTKIATEPNKENKKELRPLEAPLQTRYCPDCPGDSLTRIRDDVWYCIGCGKQFDFKSGYTTAKGNKVPGTATENQTRDLGDVGFRPMLGSE